MTTDPIEALTEILQEHIGCYSDDRPRERCVAHGTDWPCEALSDLVSEVHSWAETYAEQQQPQRCRDLEPMDLCSVCWTDHSGGIPFPTRVTATYPDDADLAAMWLGGDVIVLACDGDLHSKYDSPYRRGLHVWVGESGGFQYLSLQQAVTA